ncbi:MAG TPA: tetratricopeptide repeat protein, partial [Flavobacteriales bacterium]|nr:tetratricopeptide repeat protein [Flavobacteriales bacterium]
KTAKLVFTSLIRENPLFAPGWSNYGYVRLLEGFPEEAEYAYKKAISLNMDYVPAQLNLAGLYLYRGNKVDAKKILIRVLELEPKNSQAKEILTSLDE